MGFLPWLEANTPLGSMGMAPHQLVSVDWQASPPFLLLAKGWLSLRWQKSCKSNIKGAYKNKQTNKHTTPLPSFFTCPRHVLHSSHLQEIIHDLRKCSFLCSSFLWILCFQVNMSKTQAWEKELQTRVRTSPGVGSAMLPSPARLPNRC